MGERNAEDFDASAVAAVPVLAMPQAASAATAKPTEQELLLIKKKKAEAARKAGEKKPAAKAGEGQDAGKEDEDVSVKQKPKAERQQGRQGSAPACGTPGGPGNCRGFLDCLFGKKRARRAARLHGSARRATMRPARR